MLELVSESNGVKTYKIEAIHATITRNTRKYSEEELRLAARSLSFRPLNINHQESRILSYPQNSTLQMDYNAEKKAVSGRMQISDPFVNMLINSGNITKLSIEQLPASQTCKLEEAEIVDESGLATKVAASVCEQKGIIFTGLALLTKDTLPGDPATSILTEKMSEQLLANIAREMDDHDKVEPADQDDQMSACIAKMIEHGKDRDQAVAICHVELQKEKMKNENCNCKKGSSLTTQINKENSVMSTSSTSYSEKNKDDETNKPGNGNGNGNGNEDENQQAKAVHKESLNFSTFIDSLNNNFKSLQQVQLEKLSEIIGVLKPKTESEVKPSSIVSDKVAVESYTKVIDWFTKARERGATNLDAISWQTSKEEYLAKHSVYGNSGAISHFMNFGSETRKEAITVTSGDMPQYYSKQLITLPGGRLRVPIRQYTNFVKLDNADRANWYKIGGVDFGAITEGSEPAAASQTVTKVTAIPAVRGVLQKIGYTQVENAPFDLLQAINDVMSLAAIDDETTEVIANTYDAITPTNWVNANTGATLASDDVAGMTFKREGLLAAKRKIAEQGHDISPGNLCLFMSPKAYTELLLDTNLTDFYQVGRSNITATGMLEQVYGVDIVVSDQVKQQDNTTNDTHRNVMFVKNYALGLASARDVTFEADRRNELQQIFVTATHRVKGAVIDETATARISSAA